MRPLDDITVLELGQIYNAPYCGLLLAYMGARVIKIEPPGGDNLRSRSEPGKESFSFMMLNASKEGISLNLKEEQGQTLFLEMVKKADVVLENFSVGTMEKLGLGYERLSAVNPRLVYACSTGFGLTGPYAHYPAMDLTIQAVSGIMAVTGYGDRPPVRTGTAIADFLGGIHLMAGVLAAVRQRDRTGKGSIVEVSMHDTIFPTMASCFSGYRERGEAYVERSGNQHSGIQVVPYNVYEANDGHVAICVVSDRHWQVLGPAIGYPEWPADPRFATNLARLEHAAYIDAAIQAWTKARTRDDVFEAMNRVGIPAAPVRHVKEVMEDPHYRERGTRVDLEHPTMGPIFVSNSPIRLSNAESPDIRPAPTLGRDTDEVLQNFLDLTAAEIGHLRDAGVIK